MDPFILELVNNKVIDCGPPVQWTDIAGQVSVKAAIEEELVWPILRPGAYTGANQPPRTILLFGPRGVGKTLLSRCISTQLGSTLLKLSGTALVSKWKAEAEKILQTTFFISSCRQPAVILLTDVESVLEDAAISKSQLLTYLDKLATSLLNELRITYLLLICSSNQPFPASIVKYSARYYPFPSSFVMLHTSNTSV
uniref:AAA+ ATPase domain-containing protein n=1 Tax=Pseudonaja textilis TaxID=8673 RepID=A0A670YGI4_PSETE